MVAYHYWKCYHKESSAFQTASIYSVEVDYYHFGTCEIVDGAYFCGDHSCATYKYVGNKDVRENEERWEHETATWVAPEKDRYRQKLDEELDGGLYARMDNPVAQFQKLEGRWLNATSRASYEVLRWLIRKDKEMPLKRGDLEIVALHSQMNLSPGLCRTRCADDTSCKAYQESRWEDEGVVASCFLFKFFNFVSRYSKKPLEYKSKYWATEESGPAQGDATELSDFFLKIDNAKPKTWLHVPKSSGRGKSGRRLEGVY